VKNPELADEGLKVGDEIGIPETPEEDTAPEDILPALESDEVPYNLHEVTVIGYTDSGVPTIEVGPVIRGALLNESSALALNEAAQKIPVGSKTHLYFKA
jgi:hypothetical protein